MGRHQGLRVDQLIPPPIPATAFRHDWNLVDDSRGRFGDQARPRAKDDRGAALGDECSRSRRHGLFEAWLDLVPRGIAIGRRGTLSVDRAQVGPLSAIRSSSSVESAAAPLRPRPSGRG